MLSLNQLHSANQAPERALFIGRFQPFHKGHLHSIRTILKEFEELILLIGSAETINRENPFSCGERISFITAALPKNFRSRVLIVPVRDVNDNSKWVTHCLQYLPSFKAVFSNNSLVRTLFAEKGFEVKSTQELRRPYYQGCVIRKNIGKGEPWEHLVPKECIPLIRVSLQKRSSRQ